MKKVLILLLIVISNKAICQINVSAIPYQYIPKEKTNIEEFVNSKGKQIRKDVSIIYKQKGGLVLANFDFLKIIATDVLSGKKMNGIYISCAMNQNAKSPQFYSYIDEDEVNGVVAFLELMIEKSKLIEIEAIEYVYNTKNIQISLTNFSKDWDNRDEIRIRDWKYMFSLNELPNNEFPYYTLEKIIELKNSLKELKF
jgi:hypothetical protein